MTESPLQRIGRIVREAVAEEVETGRFGGDADRLLAKVRENAINGVVLGMGRAFRKNKNAFPHLDFGPRPNVGPSDGRAGNAFIRGDGGDAPAATPAGR